MGKPNRVFPALRRRGLPALLLAAVACASAAPPRVPESPPFAFQSNFWLNLHHFVRAVARGMPAPAELSAAERSTWDAGVAFYRRYTERSLYFDQGMVEIKEALRVVEGTTSLGAAPLDPELKATLERLAPIYRAHWWPAHDAANRAWIEAVQPDLRRHGAALSRRVAASYGQTWPSTPVPVDLSVQAGPVGAYTTAPPTHATIAPSTPGLRGFGALEILFHEASHAWDAELQDTIRKASAARNKTVPPQLWHAVLFYNAGELTRRTLLEDGVDGYVEYAVQQKVYPNLCGEGCRELVAKHWDAHLDGKVSIEEAIDGLVAAWPAEK